MLQLQIHWSQRSMRLQRSSGRPRRL